MYIYIYIYIALYISYIYIYLHTVAGISMNWDIAVDSDSSDRDIYVEQCSSPLLVDDCRKLH